MRSSNHVPNTARREPGLVCPLCFGALDKPANGARKCPQGHRWGIVAGILDCRPELKGFDVDIDRRRAEELHKLSDRSFSEVLEAYWLQENLPTDLIERHVKGDVVGGARAAEVIQQIEAETLRRITDTTTVLEVGSGTAALGVALAGRAGWVVASDVSLAWLVLARRRVEEDARVNVTLLAATADAIPYAEDTFDLVVAADVIEHVPDPPSMITEGMRVLAPGGDLWLSTPNRYSLTPEPHVRIWGVGFLPRKWAPGFVRLVRGISYDGIQTLSLREVRLITGVSGAKVDVVAPRVPSALLGGYTRTARLMISLYHGVLRVPLLRRLLLRITPFFHVVAAKPQEGSDRTGIHPT